MNSIRIITSLIFLALSCVVAVFYLHTPIIYGRHIIPDSILSNPECLCGCILDSRPWYSTFNYWRWYGIAAIPLLVISFYSRSKIKKLGLLTALLLFGYACLNLAVDLKWDIRNGPFVVKTDTPIEWQKTWDMPCTNIADGANVVFTLFLGWIPVLIYTALWIHVIGRLFHHEKEQ